MLVSSTLLIFDTSFIIIMCGFFFSFIHSRNMCIRKWFCMLKRKTTNKTLWHLFFFFFASNVYFTLTAFDWNMGILLCCSVKHQLNQQNTQKKKMISLTQLWFSFFCGFLLSSYMPQYGCVLSQNSKFDTNRVIDTSSFKYHFVSCIVYKKICATFYIIGTQLLILWQELNTSMWIYFDFSPQSVLFISKEYRFLIGEKKKERTMKRKSVSS